MGSGEVCFVTGGWDPNDTFADSTKSHQHGGLIAFGSDGRFLWLNRAAQVWWGAPAIARLLGPTGPAQIVVGNGVYDGATGKMLCPQTTSPLDQVGGNGDGTISAIADTARRAHLRGRRRLRLPRRLSGHRQLRQVRGDHGPQDRRSAPADRGRQPRHLAHPGLDRRHSPEPAAAARGSELQRRGERGRRSHHRRFRRRRTARSGRRRAGRVSGLEAGEELDLVADHPRLLGQHRQLGLRLRGQGRSKRRTPPARRTRRPSWRTSTAAGG